MPQDYAASVQGVAIRVTRLDGEGNLLGGPSDSYTTSAFIRTSFTPEYEEGDEITEKAADGTVCVSFKAPDTLKRVNLEIAICDPDPELSALLSGGLMLSGKQGGLNGPEIVQGWASAQVGEDPSGNGVAVEVWSRAIQNGKPANTNPFFRWVFPYVKTRLSGDRVIENGLLATTFEGFGLGNINFRSGIDQTWRWPAATDRPYLYAREGWAPTGLRGFYTWTPKKPDPANPAGWEGESAPTVADLSQGIDRLVGTNAPGAGNPYPYRESRGKDFILAENDFKGDESGVATFSASAASQTVKNVPSAKAVSEGAVENPVTYLSREDPISLDDVAGMVGDVSATVFRSFAKPANLAALQAVPQVSGKAFGPDEYVKLADNSYATWTGSAWTDVVPVVGIDTTGGGKPFTFIGPVPTGGGAARTPNHPVATLDDLRKMGPLGQVLAWSSGQYIGLGTGEAYWDGNSWESGKAPAVKGAAAPDDTFPAEATVTASDAGNAAKLAGLGFVAAPQTAWTTGQKITVGAFNFHWDGTKWAAGAAT